MICGCLLFMLTQLLTRMHSSRMRTVRSSSRLLGGVSAPRGCCLLPGGVRSQGGLLWGGLLLGGCLLGGAGVCLSAYWDTTPPVDRHTGVVDGSKIRNKVITTRFTAESSFKGLPTLPFITPYQIFTILTIVVQYQAFVLSIDTVICNENLTPLTLLDKVGCAVIGTFKWTRVTLC